MIGQMMIWRKVNVPTYIICFFVSAIYMKSNIL